MTNWRCTECGAREKEPHYVGCGFAIFCATEEKKMTDNITATLEERGSRYGKFTGHAEATQTLKAIIKSKMGEKWDRLADDQKEALEMICHKLGRIINGDPNYHDSWKDIGGYAILVSDRLEGIER